MNKYIRILLVTAAVFLYPAAVQAAPGSLLWTGQIGGNKATWSAPLLSDNLVIIKGQDGGMTALYADTGLQAWYTADIAAAITSPILLDGVLILGADTHLYRINPATGGVLTDRALGG